MTVEDGVGDGVTVGGTVDDGVWEGVTVGVTVGDGDCDGVTVCDGVCDGVTVGDGVCDGVTDEEGVWDAVRVGVAVAEGVCDGVTVGVTVGEGVGDGVGVGVTVCEGDTVCAPAVAKITAMTPINTSGVRLKEIIDFTNPVTNTSDRSGENGRHSANSASTSGIAKNVNSGTAETRHKQRVNELSHPALGRVATHSDVLMYTEVQLFDTADEHT